MDDMRKGSVTIIGCGWLGFPLSLKLLAEGYVVYGTTTREEKLAELEAAGIRASVLKLPVVDLSDFSQSHGTNSAKTSHTHPVPDPTSLISGPTSLISGPTSLISDPLWSADQLVINIPPNRKDPASAKTYPAAVLSALLAYRRNQPSGRIIFTSSIGVYGKDHGQAIDRDTRLPIENPTVRQVSLLLAESQVQAQSQRPHRILRLGGLYGGSRDPKKWFAGREIPRPNDPINLVSREQVMEEIVSLLDEPFWTGESVFNVVDKEHPARGVFYGGL